MTVISLLVGLILAFVSAVPLALFGAQLKSFMSTRPVKCACGLNGLSGRVKDGAESEILLPASGTEYQQIVDFQSQCIGQLSREIANSVRLLLSPTSDRH